MNTTARQSAYLTQQMKKVSRSFALVVSYLEEPLQQQMATAYLICRVLDNIEDCGQPFWWKEKRFDEFSSMLDEPGLAYETLTRWGWEPWPLLTTDELRLMRPAGGQELWRIYAQFPEAARQSIKHWALVMADGMRQMADPAQTARMREKNSVRMLTSAADYDNYCYYVAGTVGHMATELVIQHYQFDETIAGELSATCESCGLGLQKTNIVKDFVKDLHRGVSFLPDQWLREIDYGPLSLSGAPTAWTHRVLSDVVSELREATEYVLALPYFAKGYRLASLMCLLPAYQTLALAAKRHNRLFTADHQCKISRMTMMKCQLSAKSMVANNDAIRSMSGRLQHEILGALGTEGYVLQKSLS